MFTVPRIYSDELIHEDPHYLNDFFRVLSEKTYTFYCGKFTVSSNFKTNYNETKKELPKTKLYFGIIIIAMITVPKINYRALEK